MVALTIGQLQANLAALQMALGNPVMEARFPDGKVVRYRSVDDIRKAIAEVEDDIRELSGGGDCRVALAQHRRGDGPRGPGFPFLGDGYW